MMNTVFYVFTSLAFIYIFFIGIKNIFRYNMFKQEHSSLNQQFARASRVNSELKETMRKLQDDDFWEMHARKKLGFIKKNEKVYKFIQSY